MVAACLLALFLQADDARGLVQRLGSGKPEERAAAADKLKGLGRAAAPALEEAARSTDVEVAEQAKYLLKVIPIREKLSSIVFDRIPDAERRLARGGVEAWTSVLMETLQKDKDNNLIYTSLKQADLEALAAPVVAEEKNPYPRRVAFQLVVDWKLRGVLPTVAKALEDPDPDMRAAAAGVIGRLRAGEYVLQIALLLKERDSKVCVQAIDALKQLRPAASVIDEIVALLGDLRPEVRGASLNALCDLRQTGKAREVSALLKDVDLSLRAAAALTLGEWGSVPHIPAIAELLGDGEADVRRAALWSLGVLDGRERLADILPLLTDPEGRVRSRAAESLSRLNIKEKKLLALLEDPEDEVRLRAAWSLGELGFGVEELRKALKSNRPLAAGAAAHALGRLGAVDALPDIVALTRSGQEAFPRWLAVMALGELGGAEELRKLLGDPVATVRWAAVQALGRLEEDGDFPKLLTDGDPTVRMWAGLALARKGQRDGLAAVLERAPQDAGGNLLWLNRLRAPEAWKRLQETKLEEAIAGTSEEILQQLARKIQLPLQVGLPLHRHRFRPTYVIPAGMSLLRAFDRIQVWSCSEYVMDAQPTRVRYEILFDSAAVLVLPRGAAIASYKAWAQEKK